MLWGNLTLRTGVPHHNLTSGQMPEPWGAAISEQQLHCEIVVGVVYALSEGLCGYCSEKGVTCFGFTRPCIPQGAAPRPHRQELVHDCWRQWLHKSCIVAADCACVGRTIFWIQFIPPWLGCVLASLPLPSFAKCTDCTGMDPTGRLR